MTSPNLPAALVAHFTARVDATGRAALKAAQARASALYRDGGHSRDAVPDAIAALAYALVRMPATYAASVRAFDLVAAQAPDFAPSTCLDLGSGTGSATLAASAVWPMLKAATLVEPNPALSALAGESMGRTATATTVVAADVRQPLSAIDAADLVVMSYVLAEQPERDVAALVMRIAALALGMIIVVEPGTPAGYARILTARAALAAAGFDILAPCPHASACPLGAGDWCHFSVRLQRSAAHLALKDADVPFEDERFGFVAATRPGLGSRASARLIRAPDIEKGFADLALCTSDGLQTRRVRRRDKADYKRAKSLVWGDAV